jgi:uncharacterized protein YeeX (DUF496 family)
MIDITYNIHDELTRNKIYEWVTQSKYLKDFNKRETIYSDTNRKAFAVTFKKSDLPDLLHHYISNDTNIYNFIGIITSAKGDIPEHVDDDFTEYMKSKQFPGIYTKLPHTTCVYYIDICDEMAGGEVIMKTDNYKPVSNMLACFPSDEPHSVTAIEYASKPRVVLVCEKYKLLSSVVNKLETPLYRAG